MITAGITAEYNPFHNGHEHHIRKTLELTGAECIAVVMSGNFVQRGLPALADKFTRAKAAVLCGADIVIELPAVYATASAEAFAEGAVTIFDRLNNVNFLSFGAEDCRHDEFKKIAGILTDEPDEYKAILNDCLKQGLSLPAARAKALSVYFKDKETDRIISLPNNILSVEYHKALYRLGSAMQPVIIQRTGNGYNDEFISGRYPAATAVRKLYYDDDSDTIKKVIPSEAYGCYESVRNQYMPVFADSCSELVNYSLRINTDVLSGFSDIDDKLANRIRNLLHDGGIRTFTQLADDLKAKNYTYTRICRCLIHVLLNIRKNDITVPEYARVLACNETGRRFIKESRKKSDIPFITDVADAKKILSRHALDMLEKDIYASEIYRIIVNGLFGHVITDDYRHRPELV